MQTERVTRVASVDNLQSSEFFLIRRHSLKRGLSLYHKKQQPSSKSIETISRKRGMSHEQPRILQY